jgi:hypothetical protein
LEIDGDRLFAIAIISGRFDKEIAALNRQGIEEMLIEWIDRTISDIPIDTLSDEQVLALTLRAGRAIATEYTIVGRIAVFLQ